MTSHLLPSQVFNSLQPFTHAKAMVSRVKEFVNFNTMGYNMHSQGSGKFGGLHPTSDLDFIFIDPPTMFPVMLNKLVVLFKASGYAVSIQTPCVNLIQLKVGKDIKVDFTLKSIKLMRAMAPPHPCLPEISECTKQLLEHFEENEMLEHKRKSDNALFFEGQLPKMLIVCDTVTKALSTCYANVFPEEKIVLRGEVYPKKLVHWIRYKYYISPECVINTREEEWKKPFFTLTSVLKMMYPTVPSMVFVIGADIAIKQFNPEVHENAWDFTYYVIVKFVQSFIADTKDDAFYENVWLPYFKEFMPSTMSPKHFFRAPGAHPFNSKMHMHAKQFLFSEVQNTRYMESKFVREIETMRDLPSYVSTEAPPPIPSKILKFATAFVVFANNRPIEVVQEVLQAETLVDTVVQDDALVDAPLSEWLLSTSSEGEIPKIVLNFLDAHHFKY